MTVYATPKRIPPSGATYGVPPVLVGGPSQENGRAWRQAGSGQQAQMPGTGQPIPTPIPGLSAVVVDFKAGYSYDLEVDVVGEGHNVGQVVPGRQQYLLRLDLSPDGGVTWPVSMTVSVWCYDSVASGRAHWLIDLTGPLDMDFGLVRVTAQSTLAQAASLLYTPDQCVFRAQEYSASV